MATTTPINPTKQDEGLRSEVREAAGAVGDKARATAQTVADKAREAVSNLGDKAETATHNVGKGMESLAGTLRDNFPNQGVLGAAGTSVARGLESGGRYLEEEGLKGMADDVTKLIRRNPIPALFAGVALGFLLAQVIKRS